MPGALTAEGAQLGSENDGDTGKAFLSIWGPLDAELGVLKAWQADSQNTSFYQISLLQDHLAEHALCSRAYVVVKVDCHSPSADPGKAQPKYTKLPLLVS